MAHLWSPQSPQGFMSYLEDPKLIAWFGCHSNIAYHPKFIHIPVGILQDRGLYNRKADYNHLFARLRNNITKDKLLYLNFSLWNNVYAGGLPERVLVNQLFSEKPFCFCAIPKHFDEIWKKWLILNLFFLLKG